MTSAAIGLRVLTRKQKRLYLALGGMGFLGVSVALLLTVFSANLVYFYSPSDLAATPVAAGRAVRLGGLVEENTVKHNEDGLSMSFKVTDGAHDIDVTYRGEPPSLFREGQGVIAEGKIGPDGTFHAATILAKHDERYMPKEVVDALKKSGQWRGDSPAASAAAAPVMPTASLPQQVGSRP